MSMWTAVTTTSRRQVSVLVAGATGVVGAAWYSATSSLLEEAAESTEEDGDDRHRGAAGDGVENPIEIHLMDKIANKIYLQPSRVRLGNGQRSSSNSRSSHYHHDGGGGIITRGGGAGTVVERPIGVPTKLRILAIDLPEMRDQAFTRGECRIAFDKVYPDGIAPPKKVVFKKQHRKKTDDHNHDRKKNEIHNNNSTLDLEVEQKAWVRSMVRCMQNDLPNKVGVEMIEASFSKLNPYNFRKTRTLPSGYHYDPGKYTATTTSKDRDQSQSQRLQGFQFQDEDELDAPWNQYAWIEELKLRITGQVPFGDALEPASRWNQIYNGNHYKATVPSQRKWFLPSFLQSDPEGIDGDFNTTSTTSGGGTSTSSSSSSSSRGSNWASNKPHAVIANGAAVQRMPSGLRLLQKTCRDANVPLFVLYDPRAWGGNTHQTLHQALRDVRFVVKQNIIVSALEHQSGFSRGRRVGRMERSIEQWAIQAKQDRQRRQEALEKRQWQKLDAVALEKRLIEYGVLRREDRVEDGKTYRHYSPALVQIARQCMVDTHQLEEQNDAELRPSQDGSDGDSSVGQDSIDVSKAHL